MSYAEWFQQHFQRPIDEPIPRDENGLVTPRYCADATKDEHLHIVSTIYNVPKQAILSESLEQLAKRGSWLNGFDHFSFWSHGGIRNTLVMFPDGIRRWLTTKTAFDPTQAEIAELMSWRFRAA